MSLSKRFSRIVMGGVAMAMAIGVTAATTIRPAQEANAMTIIERIQMLNAAGTSSDSGVDSATFDVLVIDEIMAALHDLEEAALLGLTSDDPEVVAMSEEVLSMVEAEMSSLMSMRASRLSELLPMLRGTSRNSGVE